MSWIDQIVRHMPPSASRRQLRFFGLIVGGIFCVIGLFPMLRGHEPRTLALIVGGSFIALAALIPAALLQPYRVWMLVGHCLGWVNTKIILIASFAVLFTPVSLFMRLIKRDAMRRSFEPNLDSYRVPKLPRPPTHLKHLF